ncbi:hypothetical protein ACIQ6K_28610 [Streptomyces sp. NPDC096354]|uniref:hypothetical protein n=1 Tax=Streptomyces sp. NPDC096354 TaxID=3366088 RepID=UPI0037FC9F4E
MQARVDSMMPTSMPTPATVETVLAGVLGQLGERGRVHLEHSENVARRTGIQPADRRPDATWQQDGPADYGFAGLRTMR